MGKAIIISCFDKYSYNVRTKYVSNILSKKGFDCTFLISSFDHRNKEVYHIVRENTFMIEVPKYKKNMSLKRMISHVVFSIRSYEYVKKEKPDFVYVITPPNLLFACFSKLYKKENLKLVYDIYDLWPETLPISKKMEKYLSPFLMIWKKIREKNISHCNGIIFECDLFKANLELSNDIISKTIYLCSSNNEMGNSYEYDSKILKIVYLGSINNIIDINTLTQLITLLSQHILVEFIIVGDGEKKNDLLSTIGNKKNIIIKDCGIIYDEIEKARILGSCDFGLNLMKDSVFVGATMKSVDYFKYGLPIINNIGHDTRNFVNVYKAGLNVNLNSIETDYIRILNMKKSQEKMIQLHDNSKKVFNNHFSEEVFNNSFLEFLEKL